MNWLFPLVSTIRTLVEPRLVSGQFQPCLSKWLLPQGLSEARDCVSVPYDSAFGLVDAGGKECATLYFATSRFA